MFTLYQPEVYEETPAPELRMSLGHDAGVWALLQNAKADLHRRSIPVRAVSSRALCRRMDALEKSFDEAFETMVTQEYYLRCFEDVFDEIVSPEVEGLYR